MSLGYFEFVTKRVTKDPTSSRKLQIDLGFRRENHFKAKSPGSREIPYTSKVHFQPTAPWNVGSVEHDRPDPKFHCRSSAWEWKTVEVGPLSLFLQRMGTQIFEHFSGSLLWSDPPAGASDQLVLSL